MPKKPIKERRKKGLCCYQLPADAPTDGGDFICNETAAEGRDFCIAHTNTEDRTDEEETAFAALIRTKLNEKDYNFTGYFFPEALKVFEGRTFDTDARFRYAHFDGPALFRGTKFDTSARFDRAHFDGVAWFNHAHFNGSAMFLGANFGAMASFNATKFGGDARFEEAEFGGYAQFEEAEFGGDAWFEEAEFGGYARFDKAEFAGDAWFPEAKFGGYARFHKAEFGGGAWFGNAKFGGDASFDEAKFDGNARFDEVKFGGYAWFDKAEFGSEADFGKTRFRKDAVFWGSRFGGSVGLAKTLFKGDANFFGATVPPAGVFSFRVKEGRGASVCRFAKQVCQHMGEYQEAGDWHYEERCHTLAAKWQKAKEQLRENARSLSGLLKTISGLNEAARSHYKEPHSNSTVRLQDAKEHMRSLLGLPKALWAMLGVAGECVFIRGIFGYAEKPKRIAGVAAGIIVGSGFLYWLTKSVVLEGEPTGLFRSIYFSVVTFTTLGLGNIKPISDFGRFLVGLEAVTGAFLMAAFIVTLARRWGRG